MLAFGMNGMKRVIKNSHSKILTIGRTMYRPIKGAMRIYLWVKRARALWGVTMFILGFMVSSGEVSLSSIIYFIMMSDDWINLDKTMVFLMRFCQLVFKEKMYGTLTHNGQGTGDRGGKELGWKAFYSLSNEEEVEADGDVSSPASSPQPSTPSTPSTPGEEGLGRPPVRVHSSSPENVLNDLSRLRVRSESDYDGDVDDSSSNSSSEGDENSPLPAQSISNSTSLINSDLFESMNNNSGTHTFSDHQSFHEWTSDKYDSLEDRIFHSESILDSDEDNLNHITHQDESQDSIRSERGNELEYRDSDVDIQDNQHNQDNQDNLSSQQDQEAAPSERPNMSDNQHHLQNREGQGQEGHQGTLKRKEYEDQSTPSSIKRHRTK
jgi:hypothetical protein